MDLEVCQRGGARARVTWNELCEPPPALFGLCGGSVQDCSAVLGCWGGGGGLEVKETSKGNFLVAEPEPLPESAPQLETVCVHMLHVDAAW